MVERYLIYNVPSHPLCVGVVPATIPKVMPEEPPNSTDVEECIRRLNADDETLTEVNINNMKHVSRERLISIIDAAKQSTSIQSLAMCNTAMTDKEAAVGRRD